jgi:hypothetical protein
MKYPQLVPDRFCKIPCHIVIYDEEFDKWGAPVILAEFDSMCNYQDKSEFFFGSTRTSTSATNMQTVVKGEALFNGDIAPELPTIPGGVITIFGVERLIVEGQKNRNPDGTVNYTRLKIK